MSELTEIAVPGLRFPEGPRWYDDALWFSDQLGGTVNRVTERGHHEVVCKLDRPSGIGFDRGGHALVATMDDPCVVVLGDTVREAADLRPLAVHLNDMCVDRNGHAYVDAYSENGTDGRLVLAAPSAAPRTVAEELGYPNGVAVTPAGTTLLVSETMASRISAFRVAPDGSLSNRRVWASLPERSPDGLCLDAEGAVWVGCYDTGEFLRVWEGGEVADRISRPGRWAMACALGGDDGRTLFLCSAETSRRQYFAGESVGHLERCRVDVAGVGAP